MDDDRGIKTLREILSQAAAWESTLRDVLSQEKRIKDIFHQQPFGEVVFIGCGSTYYLSLCAASIFQSLTGIRTRALPSSELFLFPQASLSKRTPTLLVAISRSGETTETLRAAREFQENYGGNVLAITSYEDSVLATRYPDALVVKGAEERGVAQTRSFTSMLLAAQLCAGIVSGRADYCGQLKALPTCGERLISEQHRFIKELGENGGFAKFVFLGSGPNYGLACEAMLKMKEMSLSYSEAYHFMEFRHGPKSMVNDQSLVIGLLSDQARDYEISVLSEIKSLGARIFGLAEDAKGMDSIADESLIFDSGLPEHLRGVLYLPALQWLAYARSMHKGLNPDAPQNLDAVVRL